MPSPIKRDIIIAINKGGTEFARVYRKKLDKEFLFFAWQEYSGPYSPFDMSQRFTFYRDAPTENIDPGMDLRDLRSLDREIFDEITGDFAFSELLKAYLAQHERLKDMLTAYLYRHYCVPQNTLPDDFLDIYFIADLNSQDDFILLNGLLLTLHAVLPNFVPISNIRVFILGPEIETDFISKVDQITLLYQNLNLFFLVRQHVDYKTFIMQYHGANDESWKTIYHFLRFSFIGSMEKMDGAASLVIPFRITFPDTEEKEAVLHYAHDIELARLLLLPSDKNTSNTQAIEAYYIPRVEGGVSALLRESGDRAEKCFRTAGDFPEFIHFLKGIVSERLENETGLITSVKEDYIIELLDIHSIERLIEKIGQDYSEIKEMPDEEVLRGMKKQFLALKRISNLRYFLYRLMRRKVIPIKEIEGLLEYYFRSVCLKRYAEQLSSFLLGIQDIKTRAKNLLSKDNRSVNEGVIDQVVSIVGKDSLESIDTFKLRKDFCNNHDTPFYMDDKSKKYVFDRMNRLIIRDALNKEPMPWQILFSFWKAYCFPWSDTTFCRLLVFSSQNVHIANLRPFLNMKPHYRVLRKEDFTNDYYYHDLEENIPDVASEQIVPDEDGIVIYIHVGFFPFETLLLKEYKDVLKERVFKSRMLSLLIRDCAHMEVISPLQQKVNPPMDNENSEIERLAELKHRIMAIDLPFLKSNLEGIIKEVDLNRHTLANFVNSLSRIGDLMKTKEDQQGTGAG